MRAEYARDKTAALELLSVGEYQRNRDARSGRSRGLHDGGDDDHEFRRGGVQEITMPKLKLGPTYVADATISYVVQLAAIRTYVGPSFSSGKTE